MAKSSKEGMAANQRKSGSEGHRFETRCQQGLFAVDSPLKSTVPLVICIHNINSCVGLVDSTLSLHELDKQGGGNL